MLAIVLFVFSAEALELRWCIVNLSVPMRSFAPYAGPATNYLYTPTSTPPSYRFTDETWLRNIPLLLEITRAVVKASRIPVTVKTRLGWDHQNIIIEDLAEALQDCGIAALTIHGRTRSDMYNGNADWSLIGAVKNNPRITIPIIGNGDITTPQEAKEAFDRYGVDAVMVGRASIGRPWVFEEMRHYLDTGELLQDRPASERLDTLIQMIKNNIDKLDERRGILHSRRHLAASPIFKGIANFRPWRIAMLQATTMEQLLDILAQVRTILSQDTLPIQE